MDELGINMAGKRDVNSLIKLLKNNIYNFIFFYYTPNYTPICTLLLSDLDTYVLFNIGDSVQ